MKKITAIVTVLSLMAPMASVRAAEDNMWKYGLNGAKGFNENTYSEIVKQTTGGSSNNWRDASMTGNGETAIIENFSPSEDVIIYNNTKLVLGTNDIYDVADVSANLDNIRKTAADRTNPGQWQGWVKNYWNSQYGASNHLSSNTKTYHPAAQLRIKNNSYTSHDEYNRYTNFETGEIGMQWRKDGKEYNSRTFVSRADDTVVTIIEAPEGEELNLTFSVDNLLEMGIDSTSMKTRGVEICPESKEITKQDENGYSFGQIVKYGDFNAKGNDSNPDAHGAKGGYATAIRLLPGDGAVITENSYTHQITANEKFNTADDTQKFTKSITTPTLTLTGTDKVMLVSKVDVRLEGYTDVASVEGLYDELLSDVDEALTAYGVSAGVELFNAETVEDTVTVKNNFDTEKVYRYIAAEYADGRLVSVDMDSKKVAPGETVTLTINKSDTAKVFLWADMMPVDPETGEPTTEPTTEPTAEPTTEPTGEPTTEPTAEPTAEPTGEPTTEPTGEPTIEPTGEPTIEPTTEPTIEPTIAPTADPTAEPTAEPTTEPTIAPTATPMPTSVELTALYSDILEPHAEAHGAQFEGVELSLCSTAEEIADRELTNTALNEKQRQSSEINKAWLERLYDNGRFGLICSSGYNTSRLGGIWVGNWMPDWSGDFTQDANVNLQVSAVNTTGLKDASQSYMSYILRQVSDWEKNAKNIYGIDDAIMAGPRTDGDGNGTIYHTLAGYPFMYWNTGADWLIIPIYEYWQCYGNEKIPVGEDVDLDELKSVLDLTDADKERISKEGFDLEQDILAPLLTKLYNFWQGYTSDKFFISEDGTTMHLNDGTQMGENDKFMFTPGYSPENVPSKDKTGYNGAPSLAANTTMDISAAKDSMNMVSEFIANGAITDITAEEVSAFENKFPSYLYAQDGSLKEWAVANYEEQYNHRHVSHTYSAWPAYEAQNDFVLREGLASALNMRYHYNVSDNAQAHGHLHNALVEARIKRVPMYEKCLHTLIAANYEYAALMTSHNRGHGSAFCTDNAFGLLGVVTEGLIYSDDNVIEVLPALADSFDDGSITGLMARCKASVDLLEWNKENVNVSITSLKDSNIIRVMCGEGWSSATVNDENAEIKTDENGQEYVEISLNKDETAQVEFTLNALANGTYYLKNSGGTYLGVSSYGEGAQTDDVQSGEKWNITYCGNGKYRVVNTLSGRVLTDTGCYKDSDYLWSADALSVFTAEQQKTEIESTVADSITISTNFDTTTEINAGKSVTFEATEFVPGAAIVNGVVWHVKAADDTELSSTRFNSNVLTIGTDALGKELVVYALSPDGSCKSNEVTLAVAEHQVRVETLECEEDFEYGFGNYKKETTSIGTINGKAIIKFSDVSFDNLLSVYFFKSNTNPSKTTLYYDLEETAEKTFYDDYGKDSGEGKGEASKRYAIGDVTVDESKRISETVLSANGDAEVSIGLADGLSGTHDLYVVIDSNGSTWNGNYDYMQLSYKAESVETKTEFESYTYGYTTSGTYKIDTRVANAGSCSGGARVHNIGGGGVQYFTFENVDFSDAVGMTVNCQSSGNATPLEIYISYSDADGMEITNTEEVGEDTNSSVAPRLASVAPDLTNAVKIGEGTISSSNNGYENISIVTTDDFPSNGTYNVCIVMRGSGWKGDYDYFTINALR